MKYIPKKVQWADFEKAREGTAANWERLEAIDREMAKKSQLLWRYIAEPIADGNAVYQITKVGKTKVRIKVCTGLGDDWVVPYWGAEASVDRSYAEKKVRSRDGLASIFKRGDR